MPPMELIPLPTTREVEPGDDLTALLLSAAADAGLTVRDGDVVCVASKVVSKSEGAFAELPEAADVHAARRILATREAARIVADTPWVLVVETRHGFVCANAGIDTSNVDAGRALLLPEDPDASAAQLRAAVGERTGADVGVVVTDTFGRPWRMGQTDVALGAAGITALRDERGTTDMQGRTLEVTLVAVADELAAAADLVRRKADGTPFVLIRGADVAGAGTARELLRPAAEDIFRHGVAPD
jgi:coenzyme F420-0:L-glutamate ligase/coenzyme F420-1:gamma-L-glutamate ligase